MCKKLTTGDAALLDGATYDDVTKLAEGIAGAISHSPELSARFLALCHIFTYTDRMAERENFLRTVEMLAAPFTPSFDDGIKRDKADALAGVRSASK